MAISQRRSKRKYTGGLYHKDRKKKLYELGNVPIFVKLGPTKLKKLRVRGGNTKVRLINSEYVNVSLPDGKCNKEKILKIKANPANRNYVIRNFITKGTIVETSLGDAIITSRPGQEGTLNAKLITENKKS